MSRQDDPGPLKDLPPFARLFVGTVIALGAVVLGVFLPRALSLHRPAVFVALLVLSSVTSAFKVSLPLAKGKSTMSVSYPLDFASLLLLGPDTTMLVAAVSAWSQCTFRMKERNPIYKTLFSMACLVITVQAAGRMYMAFGGVPGHFTVQLDTLTEGVRLLIVTGITYFLFNTVLVATAVSLSTSESLPRVWYENFLWSAPSYLVGAAVGAISAGIIDRSDYWLVPLGAAPLYLTYRSYKIFMGRVQEEQRQVRAVSDLHLATVEALALAIDAKDQTTQTQIHIRRVQTYAAGLARALDMSEAEIQGVKTAALLHDIGKLAVPEHILAKPGPLTEEEFQKIRMHPEIGAEIIGAVPFPYPVAPLIRNHHERWDGKGYPAGLKGEAIPLGARILTVVDYFDALRSDRPYHKAVNYEAAIALLRQEAGGALQPELVEKFVELLPSLETDVLQSVAAAGQPARLHAKRSEVGRPAAGFAFEPPGKNVLDDIALAHREIYALYEIAQTMGTSLGVADTMSLIASKLSNLVPVSCCALFLYNEEQDTLQCRFATGTDAETVLQVTVHNGHGLTGWVARNRRPLVNARPSADLEAAGLTSPTSLQSALVSPLIFNERFIGALSVYHVDPSCYSDDHCRLMERICEQAAAVIFNSIVFEQTQEDSLTDPLTGLPNTRFMFMHLSRELARADRFKSEVALLVMDLDSFKEINDNFGHHVGDRALCEVASVLRVAIRPYDMCIRYAGDEFIVVLSGCGADEAERKRLELQKAVQDLHFEPRPDKQLRLGISVGAAIFPHDGQSYEALLATADSRMYRDKSTRKRSVATPGRTGKSGDLAEIDLDRAASGIL